MVNKALPKLVQEVPLTSPERQYSVTTCLTSLEKKTKHLDTDFSVLQKVRSYHT